MKVSVMIVLVLLTSSNLRAQIRSHPEFLYNGKEFGDGVNRYLQNEKSFSSYISIYLSKLHFYLHSSLCNRGVALIKFKVNNNGLLSDLAVSKQAPSALSVALKEALIASQKYWKAGKAETLFIQPVVYNFDIDCKEITTDQYSEFGGFFLFDDGFLPSKTNCIILEPVVINSGVKDFDLTIPKKR